MYLEDKDIPKIINKGYELARDLLSPDSFYSLAVHQRKGRYGAFVFQEKTGKLILKTPSKTLCVNPDKITEQGVAICKSSRGDITFKEGGRKGIAMSIEPSLCGRDDNYLGSLHTHPGGNAVPSTGDLGASTRNKDKIMCIATRLSKKEVGVNCYIPKTDWLPEEISAMDLKVQDVLNNIKDEMLNINISDRAVFQIPVYDNQKVKWFSGALMDEIRNYYTIKRFTKEI